MSTWKPGDVAMVTVDYGRTTEGARDVICFRTPGWWRDSTNGNSYGSALGEVKAARPLVVIDPEDTEAVKRLVSLYNRQFPISDGPEDAEAMADALREFANPTPPRPDEPKGLGAVVRDGIGNLWIRWSLRPDVAAWRTTEPNTASMSYARIDAVEVLSEGWSA